MSDEYKLPTEEEVEASGTGKWVDDAVKHHGKKQEKLARTFFEDKEAVRREKEQLAQMWSAKPPGPDPDEAKPKGPDLFADERSRGAQAKQSLASIFGDDMDAKRAEEDALRNMFGPPSGGGKKKPKR